MWTWPDPANLNPAEVKPAFFDVELWIKTPQRQTFWEDHQDYTAGAKQ